MATRMEGTRACALLVFALTVSAAAAGAQGFPAKGSPPTAAREGVDERSDLLRLGLGIGKGSLEDGESSISARLAMTFSPASGHLVTLRTLMVQEFMFNDTSPGDKVWDAGLLYGRRALLSGGFAAASVGVALVRGVHPDGESFRATGIPVELEIGLSTSTLGIGVVGFGSFNRERSMSGVAVSLLLGRLP